MLQDRSIILIGFMGTGKTTIGEQLAKRLSLAFIDTDEKICSISGLTIPEIFQQKGEKYFRQLESQVLTDVLAQASQVVSTGGGIVIQEVNRQLLNARRQKGDLVIWLTASEETLWQRLKLDSNRPLLKAANPREEIASLLRQREDLYRSVADYTISTSEREPAAVVTEIIDIYSKGGF